MFKIKFNSFHSYLHKFNKLLYQVAHDSPQHGTDSNIFILEYVWGRCKLCGQEVGEMRVFGDSQLLKKVISATDHPAFAESIGFGCRLFEKHLTQCEELK
jgi:hypothetical protein